MHRPTIDSATARVEKEIDLVRTERDAFAAFLARLREVTASSPDTAGIADGPTALATVQSSPSTALREIQRAYRETVMAVPHYDREYGDTLQESLTAELGETLAGHVVDGQTLTPAVNGALCEATTKSRDERDDFLRLLRQEHESLCAVAEGLDDTGARRIELADRIEAADTSIRLARIDEELQSLEQRCTHLTTRRQERIHNRRGRTLSGVDAVSLPRYLYDDMETVTPALADVVCCLDAIRDERTRCLR